MLQANNPQADFIRELQKLNEWQEEQQKLLEERQKLQLQNLGLEQQNMYEMLGLNGNLDVIEEDKAAEEYDCVEDLENLPACRSEKKLVDDTAVTITEDPGNKPTRKFLKRGEGLTQRFKIDPELLRLNNLPRYKFAGTHAKYKFKPERSNTGKDNAKAKQEEKKESDEETGLELDAQEQRFQQRLFLSKTRCNSTPDIKSLNSSSNASANVPKVRFVELEKERERLMENAQQNSNHDLVGTSMSMQPMSWSKVLDPQQIKPNEVHQLAESAQDTDMYADDLSIFELLEQKANDGSIDMNSTCVRQFIQRKSQSEPDESDNFPVDWQLKEVGLSPLVQEITDEFSSDLDEDEYEDNTRNNRAEESDFQDAIANVKGRVRFSKDSEICEFVEEVAAEASMLAGDESTLTSDDMFQQFKAALFAALQNKADAASEQENKNESDALPITMSSKEMQDKTDLIKTRLAELEKEILTFKDNNMQLIRSKQEHELEKALYSQEHNDAMQMLNDDKIAMEIYLHDERMKIEDAKRAFEQQMHIQKSTTTTKDRREIARLKDVVNDLQGQLKQKEHTHVSAQARLRAQIRNMEKDQKQLIDDIDRLNKENKRLEKKCLQIERESSNKMLQEINRNIARLAPKMSSTSLSEPNAMSRVSTKTKPTKGKKATTQKIEKCMPHHTTHGRNLSARKSESSFNQTSVAQQTTEGDNSPLSETESEKSTSNHESQKSGTSESVECTVQATTLESSGDERFKREIINADGSKDIWYPNGNLKKISADCMIIRMLYFNKDIKETNINEGTVKYYYSDSNTWHTTYLDGLEILEFPNGQTEHRFKNGVVEVHFPNNSVKITNPTDENKKEEWRFVDGTSLVEMRNGDRMLMLPNGQKEIHTKLNKRREYPDGTVKLVYPDGSQETRYSNGRRRLKDKDGKLVLDSANNTDY